MIDNLLDIILVESNPSDVDFALESLEEHNLANRLKVLRDGKEALDYIFRQGEYRDSGISDHPVLILLDVKLPKVDGLEILRSIRGDERTKRIPVVLITGTSSEAQKAEGYNLGVNSYIIKPIEFDKFAKAISQIGLYWAMLNEPPL